MITDLEIYRAANQLIQRHGQDADLEAANLKAATALHFAHYNFCRIHSTLRTTPAMAAGVAPDLWSLERLLPER